MTSGAGRSRIYLDDRRDARDMGSFPTRHDQAYRLGMPNPIIVDVPHKLGRAEAKRRLAAGIDRVFQYVPGGANVSSSWPSEDQMLLDVKAMGQSASAVVDVDDHVVRITMTLPPLLAMMGNKISDAVRRSGEQLLLR